MLAALLVISVVTAADAERGRQAMEQAQCNRCHTVEGIAPAPDALSCTGCHQWIITTANDPGASSEARREFPLWNRHVERVRAGHFTLGVPSLNNMGKRLRPEWIRDYLRHPHDVRPNLSESMIRPAFDDATIDDVTAWLTRDAADVKPTAIPPANEATVSRGAALFESRGCAACHLLGSREFPSVPNQFSMQPYGPRALAPDLKHTRNRFRPEMLVAWIKNPRAIKPDTPMPTFPVTDDEAKALAAFILHADPGESKKPTAPSPVKHQGTPTWKDVDERVFSRVCIHCHMDPDLSGGDGGPGNTGGFGYRALGLSFSSYADVLKGSVDAKGRRQSIFRKGASGAPVLLERLRQRHRENARDRVPPGADGSTVNVADAPPGMPMGLPALSPEEMALIEAWVAAGHPGPRNRKEGMSAYYGDTLR